MDREHLLKMTQWLFMQELIGRKRKRTETVEEEAGKKMQKVGCTFCLQTMTCLIAILNIYICYLVTTAPLASHLKHVHQTEMTIQTVLQELEVTWLPQTAHPRLERG